MAKQECSICHDEFDEEHSQTHCIESLARQLTKSKEETLSWRDTWYKQRTATGKMAWEMPNPYYIKDSKDPYLQSQFKIFLQFASEFIDRPAVSVSMREEIDPFNNFEE